MLGMGLGPGAPAVLRRRAESGFDPASLGDLAAHYDAALALFQDSAGTVPAVPGGPVGRVGDLSGNGRHLVQAVGAARPLLREVAGRRSIRFGGAHWLDLPATLQIDKRNSTMLIVLRTRSADIQALCHMPAGSSEHALYIANGIGAGELRLFSNGPRSSNATMSHGTAVAVAVNRAAEVELRLGREAAAGLAPSPAGTVAGGWIGQWNGDAFRLIAHVHEILVYARALQPAEIERLLDHLGGKHRALARDETCFIAFEGDSITEGIGASVPEDQCYPAQLARRCPSQPKWMNFGTGGDSIQNMAATTGTITGMLAKNQAYAQRLVALLAGTNDINNGRSEGQVRSDIDAWIAAIRAADAGARPFGCTILPRTDFTAEEEAARLAVNAHIRGAADFDFTVDLAADERLADPANPAIYGDGIHPTDAGYAIIAEVVHGALAARGYL